VAEAKSAIRGRLLLGLETNADLGWWLAEMSLFLPDEQAIPDMFAAIDAVSAADVARVAHEYLVPEKRFRVVHRPSLTPASLRAPSGRRFVVRGPASAAPGERLHTGEEVNFYDVSELATKRIARAAFQTLQEEGDAQWAAEPAAQQALVCVEE